VVEVSKIWEGIRLEGLNYGLPSTFLQLGIGPNYSSEELVRDVLMQTKCKWLVILGENTTQVGMGSLVKGLSSIGMYIELEVDGRTRDPGWMHSVERWVVDYVKGGAFNYGALRSQDMVRFTAREEKDLPVVEEAFELLKFFTGTKVLRIPKPLASKLWGNAFALVRKYERSRLYTVDLD